jgi:hypothetical protein
MESNSHYANHVPSSLEMEAESSFAGFSFANIFR